MAAVEIGGRYTIVHHHVPAQIGLKAYIRRRDGTDTFDVRNERGQDFPGNPVKLVPNTATGELVLGAWGGRVSTLNGVTIIFPGVTGAPDSCVVWKRD